jgi:hypothetical protein
VLNESSSELYGYGWALWWDFSDEPERGFSFVSLKAHELEQDCLGELFFAVCWFEAIF